MRGRETGHRRSGLLFVYAMLVMGFSASILGARQDPPENVRAGLLTTYFVVTALTTVRPATRWTRGINVAALIVAAALALFSIVGAVKIFNLPDARTTASRSSFPSTSPAS